MTITQETPGKDQSYFDLAERFRQLSLLTWKCNAEGHVIHSPKESGALSEFVASPKLIEAIEAFAANALKNEKSQPAQLVPGCWAIAAIDRQGLRAVSALVVVLFEPKLLNFGTFEQLASSAQVNLEQARDAIKPLLQRSLAVEQAAKIVEWTHGDYRQSHRSKTTLEQTGHRLIQSYEETHLLFRLARFLNDGAEADVIIQKICEEMRQILPFPWIAIRFDERRHEVPVLSGKLLWTGELPTSPEELNHEAQDLFAKWNAENWVHRLLPESSPFAAAAGSEVLAEAITHDGKVIGALLAGSHPGVSSPEMQFVDAVGNFLGIFHENLARFEEQRSLFLGALQALTSAIDAKDRYTCGHSERVAHLASALIHEIAKDSALTERYRLAGLVHDVGKIGVPEAVLCKVGRLTEDEFAQIKLHPEIGQNILKDIPNLGDILPGVLHHHERYDGRGYPAGLAGQEIPLIARVLALADTFDAMSSTRSYRAAIARPQVLAEIRKCAGSQFDPQLAEIFVNLDFSGFDALLDRHKTIAAAA